MITDILEYNGWILSMNNQSQLSLFDMRDVIGIGDDNRNKSRKSKGSTIPIIQSALGNFLYYNVCRYDFKERCKNVLAYRYERSENCNKCWWELRYKNE